MKLKRSTLFAAMAGLLIVNGTVQTAVTFPRWQKDFSTAKQGIASGLSADQLLFALAGFREMIAGILWVRADSFFDNGNYDAILPLVRLVTWLDPHQIDVYATGTWHIAYNFTDDQQRSDRRYIPSALAFVKEGAENNPDTYELFFESGWLWYHKIEDNFDKPVYWFEEAIKRKDITPGRSNILGNVYVRANMVDKSLEYRLGLFDKAEQTALKENSWGNSTMRDTREQNLDTEIIRMSQRGYFAQKRNDGSFNAWNYDVKPPFDVGFSARAVVEESMVLRVMGTWNVVPVGTRIRATLRDVDYPNAYPSGMDWDKGASIELDPPKDLTFMQDLIFVRNNRFNKRIDMSLDPTMYPVKRNKSYVLELYYNPRLAPHHIQDKFGFNGEGMTDKNFLNTTLRKDQRVIFASFTLTGEQLRREGQWGTATPTVQTNNYVPLKTADGANDIIAVPPLRGGAGNPPPRPNVVPTEAGGM